jgi:predicted transcriptional regulator
MISVIATFKNIGKLNEIYHICNSRIANKEIFMKKHSGMRPQDIVVLHKIVTFKSESWLMKDISTGLNMSASEVSESLNRSSIAGLLDQKKKKLFGKAFLEFLVHGLKYVYPQQPGALVRGIPTAHSAPPLNKLIQSQDEYVWPHSKGTMRGQLIEPLYAPTIDACLNDYNLYELLALTDALRIGKVREVELAKKELTKKILDGK